MITFKKIKYKNFLSSGNYWTEIELNKNGSTLVIGKNGAGKSTFLDSLTFALFNKPFRKINKNQLVNSINEKDCVVEVDFEASNHTWKIVRGIKPAIFKVYKDDKEESQLSSITDQQKWLEQNVLGMNFKSFIQIVVLGSSNYIPFMQLPSQHRREVVEDFLDIKVFSSMNDITKVRIKELKDEIREFQFKKENIKDKIHSQEVFINQLEERDKEDVQEKNKKIDKIANDKDHFEKENKKLLSAIEILNIQIERLSNSTSKLTKLQKIKSTLQDKSNRINSDKSFFETNVSCPTCTQSIEDEFRLKKISEIKFKDSEIQTALEDLEKTIVDEDLNYNNFLEFSNKVAKLNSDINHNNIKISQLDVQYNELQKEIKKLLSRNKDVSVEYSKLQTLKDSLEKCIEDISEKKEDLLNHEFIHLLLKDDGAKTKIIKKYLPAINYNLNKFLDLMNFTINFSLDEEFNEKSLNPIYEDFSYSSFSEGEKFRIDLAILFTWREIAKIKNSVNCNLLILDEIFDSSLDDFGTDYFSSIIKFVIKNSNIFIISHKTEELLDKFDSVIKFEKKKGFSVMLDT
jgi:DNA repair exonuclease SbcCD ATPase subunit